MLKLKFHFKETFSYIIKISNRGLENNRKPVEKLLGIEEQLLIASIMDLNEMGEDWGVGIEVRRAQSIGREFPTRTLSVRVAGS